MTNGQTTYLFKAFYPCLLRMDSQYKWTNSIFIQSILPMSFYNGHTGQTDKQHIKSKYSTHVFLEWTHMTNRQTTYSFKSFYPCLSRMDTQDKRTNKTYGQTKYSSEELYMCLFRMDTQDKRTNNIFIQRILPMSF